MTRICFLGVFGAHVFWAILAAQAQAVVGAVAQFSLEQARSAGPGHFWQGRRHGVNLYSHAKQTSVPLVRWRGRGGLAIGFTIHHSSQAVLSNAALGPKWLHSYDTTLLVWPNALGGRAALVWGDHTVQMFSGSGSQWTPLDGYRDTLAATQGGFRVTLKSQTLIDFVPAHTRSSWLARYRLAAITDPNGNAIGFTYDAQGRLERVADPSGRALELSYSSGKLSAVAFVAPSFSRTWSVGFDGAGRPQQVAWPLVTTDTGSTQYSMQLAYNGSHNVVGITDLEGHLWTYGYDGDRLAFELWPANDASETFDYTFLSGGVRTLQDPRGNLTTYQYDGLSRLVRHVDAEGFGTDLGYADPDFEWSPSEVVLPSTTTYRADYDASGNVVGRTDPSGQRWDYVYDARNNLIRRLEPLVTDAWGVPEPARHKTEYDYDASNNLIQMREYWDATSFYLSQFTYNGFGEMLSFVNARSRTVQYSYDGFGNLVRLQTPLNRVVEWRYETADATFGFSVPNAWVDGLNQRTDLLNDEWGRLRERAYPGGGSTRYSYDGLSRMVRMQDQTGETLWHYNGNGWLLDSVKGPWSVTYGYFPNGRRASLMENAPSGTRAINYDYTPRNQLMLLADGGPPTLSNYDPDGRLSSRQLATGASSRYFYVDGRLASVQHLDQLGVPIATFDYAYQQNAIVGQVTDLDGVQTRYDRDFLNRLTREQRLGPPAYDFNWTYDEVGNRTLQDRDGVLTTYSHDDDNRLVEAVPQGQAPEIYGWNGNGQLVSRIRQNGAEDFQFSYDFEGNLTQMLEWNGSFYEPNAFHLYDGLDRRWIRDAFVNGVPDKHSEYFYDGANLLRDVSMAQSPSTTAMTWAGGLLNTHELPGGNAMWSATDGSGDMRRWTDDGGQASPYKTIFNSFGETISQQGQPITYAFAADSGWRSEGDAGMIFTGDGFHDPTTSLRTPSWPGAMVSTESLMVYPVSGSPLVFNNAGIGRPAQGGVFRRLFGRWISDRLYGPELPPDNPDPYLEPDPHGPSEPPWDLHGPPDPRLWNFEEGRWKTLEEQGTSGAGGGTPKTAEEGLYVKG